MEAIIHLDKELTLVINGLHQGWLDELMYWISNKYVWIPLYVLVLAGLVRNYGWQKALLAAGLAGVMILIADQTASSLLKPWVERLRPCHDPLLVGDIHLVRGKCGGPYGFASSHAANFFGMATYFSLFFRQRNRLLPFVFFLAAILVAFSRVYLGAHFLGDVLAGGLIGVAAGLLVRGLYLRIESRLWGRKPSRGGR